jgi:hypothetical protein
VTEKGNLFSFNSYILLALLSTSQPRTLLVHRGWLYA